MTECLGESCTLIKRLLDSKSLSCQVCKKLLQLPVFSVQNVGTVCANCKLENDWNGIEIGIFNVLLKDLTIPCTNATVGCDAEIPHESLDEHSKICKYRPVKCPHQDCVWMERQDLLSGHFLEDHKENVIQTGSFSFELDLEEACGDFAKLLVKRGLKFLFVFKQDKEAGEMSCSLFKSHEGASGEASGLTTIAFRNAKGREFSFKIDTNQLSLIDHQSCSVEKINMIALKSLCHEDDNVLTMVVNIPPSDRLLQYLECPICNDTMRPPIFQCEKGHSICKVCFEKLTICPACRSTISRKTRNYSLDSLISYLLVQ